MVIKKKKKTKKKKLGTRKSNREKRRSRRGGFFGGVGDAPKPGKGYPFIIPGTYFLLVTANKATEGREDDYFISEFKVLSREDVEEDRPVGSMVSWLVGMSKPSADGNVRDFVAVCAGEEFDDITEDDCESVVSKEQPLKGTVLKCIASNTKTRAKTNFTIMNWELVGDLADYKRLHPTKKRKKKVLKRKRAKAR